MPVFNGERYLREALDSCLAQTLRDWELVIVDDGSTDGTQAIVDEYASREPRIRPVKHERNQGLPGALNTGFSIARGELLTWTSHDNRYRPTALAAMEKAIGTDNSVDVVYADVDIIDTNGKILRHQPVRDIAAMGFRGNVVGSCFLYGRKVHDAAGGYAHDLFLAEDYYFWLCAADRFRFRPIHQCLYDYRIHSGTLTSRFPDARPVGNLALDRAFKQTSSRLLKAGILINFAIDHRRDGLSAKVLQHIAEAMLMHPWATIRYSPWRSLLTSA